MQVDMDPATANRLVESLGASLRHGGEALEDVPRALREVLETGAWRDFVTRRGQRVQYERFEDFVTTPPLAGVGGSLDLVRRIATADPVTLDLLDQALQHPVGVHHDSDNVTINERGNDRTYALRRLRNNRPDLHAKVLAGDKSPHAAMVEAGFRKRTINVPLELEAAARTLCRHFDPTALIDALRREA